MLDMGFEREMDACLALIKKRCKDKFTPEAGTFHSELIKINFISATLSSKVQALGAKLMQSYKQVGFANNNKNVKRATEMTVDENSTKGEELDKDDEENIIDSIPK